MITKSMSVLFLCTGNSARSILGEYLLKLIGRGRFDVHSAGTEPAGTVHPFAIRVLREVYDIDASDARSKSCDEFNGVRFDFVITVCDSARESCPIWPGQPMVAHWGVPDPALATGSDAEIFEVFRSAALLLQRRIERFCALPFERLDSSKLERLIKEIGCQSS